MWRHLLGMPDLPLWRDLLNSAAPFIGVLIYGSFHHLFFRLFGSRRRITSSWAISVYATAGLPTLLGMAYTPIAMRLHAAQQAVTMHPRQHPQIFAGEWRLFWTYSLIGGLVSLVAWLIQVSALSGLHGMTRRRTMLVLLVCMVVYMFDTTLVFGQAMVILRLLHREQLFFKFLQVISNQPL
jgi:hypothetical protein